MKAIKGIIFDYGGTIDSNGDHWAEVIWDGYRLEGIPVTKTVFREAYIYAERALAMEPYIRPDHCFYDLLRIKIGIQIDRLINIGVLSDSVISRDYVGKTASYCYEAARRSVNRAREIIALLSDRYPLVLVSNFYGNIETVLSDFGLDAYFGSVIESAVVGVRKPDPEIFAMGVRALHLRPDEVLVVGDSYRKDIEPANRLGCRTIWLKGRSWDDKENEIGHEQIITDFVELKDILL